MPVLYKIIDELLLRETEDIVANKKVRFTTSLRTMKPMCNKLNYKAKLSFKLVTTHNLRFVTIVVANIMEYIIYFSFLIGVHPANMMDLDVKVPRQQVAVLQELLANT